MGVHLDVWHTLSVSALTHVPEMSHIIVMGLKWQLLHGCENIHMYTYICIFHLNKFMYISGHALVGERMCAFVCVHTHTHTRTYTGALLITVCQRHRLRGLNSLVACR